MKKALLPNHFAQKLLPLVFLLAVAGGAFAQANLSVQGTVLKSNGAAVDDGAYSMTFRLYTTDAGGSALWTETQSSVDINGGVYSVTLGTVTPLTVAFDVTYYLGVTVASGTELTPRARLTSSPYALSLIGQDNKFPSTGAVGVGTATPAAGSKLHVKNASGAGKITLEGTTGESLEFKQGGNTAAISYDGSKISISNFNLVITDDVNLPAGKTISYNGLDDWRLIDVDNFETTSDGWTCYTDYYTNTTATFERIPFGGPINSGYVLRPLGNAGNAFRKTLNLAGIAHTQVKVTFTAILLNSVDSYEGVYGAFSNVATPVQNYTNVGEVVIGCKAVNIGGEIQSQIGPGGPEGYGWSRRLEMVVRNASDTIYLIIDSTMNEAVNNENFGIGNVEIWVK